MLKRIERLLRETMGLDAASVGSSLIERAVRLRMKKRGMREIRNYCGTLDRSPAELNRLIEAVVVPETWFFRDKEPFAAMAGIVMSEWLPTNPTGQLRVLSVPCSSGEEPYSIVMTLLDAGLPPERFDVRAVDISGLALARARRGVYGKNSFRAKDLGFRNRFFKQTKDGFAINEPVRSRVTFQRGNLLDEKCLPQRGVYDFIFCRNLLIYFDRGTRAKAVGKLENLLTTNGICFVGAAELPLVLGHGFVSANIPQAFACRKANRPPQPNAEIDPRQTRSKESPAQPKTVSPPALPLQPRPPAGPLLEEARRLADEGKLVEAAAAYYLLGLAHEAKGAAKRAEDCYRKALYLEPNHHEALTRLALLKEKNGDADGARIFQRRALRTIKQDRIEPVLQT
jgi:chemotaxis protein methyltransferase WspC